MDTKSLPREERLRLAQCILEFYSGREDYIYDYGIREGVKPDKPVGPVPRVDAERFADYHLAGRERYGDYLIRLGDTVLYTCIDIDNHQDREGIWSNPHWEALVKSLTLYLKMMELPHYVEISGSGRGAHIGMRFDRETPPTLPREFWAAFGNTLGLKFDEINPKQDSRLACAKQFGNQVSLPLWNQSRFVRLDETKWTLEEIDPAEALSIRRITPEELSFWTGRCRSNPMDERLNEPRRKARSLMVSLTDEQIAVLPSELPRTIQRALRNENSKIWIAWEKPDLSDCSVAQARWAGLVLRNHPSIDEAGFFQCNLAWCAKHGYEKGSDAYHVGLLWTGLDRPTQDEIEKDRIAQQIADQKERHQEHGNRADINPDFAQKASAAQTSLPPAPYRPRTWTVSGLLGYKDRRHEDELVGSDRWLCRGGSSTGTGPKVRLVQLADEIISVLAADPNAMLKITVEIQAEFPAGASDQIKRAVSENAGSLGFKSKSWE